MSAQVKAVNWRLVEVGRVVLTKESKELATIVEIIDQKRVLIDGPKVARQAISLNKLILTPLVIAKLPRACGSKTVAKKWAAAEIDSKWAATSWAKQLAAKKVRATLTDFERFQVSVYRKQHKLAVAKAVAKA